jgi:hypothetical protein
MAKNVSKGFLPWLAVLVLLVPFLVGGCDLLQKEDDSLQAPDVGSASQLSSFTGTVPASSADSKSLFLNAKNALDTEIDSYLETQMAATLHPSRTLSKALRQKATQTNTTPINLTFDLGGGTVTMNGSEEDSVTQTDPVNPNSSFSFSYTFKEDITATVKDVTVPLQGSPTYEVNGTYVYKVTVNVTISGNTDANGYPVESSLKLSYSITLQMGVAMSVSSSTGTGGKFIVTFPFEYSKSGISLSAFNEEAASLEALLEMENDLMQKLQETTASLKVYDNGNTLKYSANLTLAELEAIDF